MALVLSSAYSDFDTLRERLREFLQDNLDQGACLIISSSDERALAFLETTRYRTYVIPSDQFKDYCKRYASFLFVAVNRTTEKLISWLDSGPLYNARAPMGVLVGFDGIVHYQPNYRS